MIGRGPCRIDHRLPPNIDLDLTKHRDPLRRRECCIVEIGQSFSVH